MLDRIFKNWKTTIFGLSMIAFCFVLVGAGKASLSEVGTFILGGFALFFTKDGTPDNQS
ncbi:MAG: hypothetical protein N4A72_10820 [Bacteroidales bacterium]|jgi:hypothetical protein|nr:hypothetical protein [Bacteroidales bacterium]